MENTFLLVSWDFVHCCGPRQRQLCGGLQGTGCISVSYVGRECPLGPKVGPQRSGILKSPILQVRSVHPMCCIRYERAPKWVSPARTVHV